MRRPLLLGAGIGVVAVLVLVAAMAAGEGVMSRNGFCISCHEMESTVYQEYRKTKHFQSASGVRATCSSCHVPEAFGPMVVRKAESVRELVSKVSGTIDTPEKFEANRLRMAKSVWADMKANDSRECRSCHDTNALDYALFPKKEDAERMRKGLSEGQTCVDCHKGLSHTLPDMASGYKALFEELSTAAQSNGTDGDSVQSIRIVPLFLEKDGRPMGRVMPLTALSVQDRDGEWAQVRVEGWQQDGVTPVVYEMQGRRIFSVVLDRQAESAIEVESTMVDPDTELTWHKVGLTCWVKAGTLLAESASLLDYGAELHGAACGTCHSATPPDHFKANQWIGSLKSMKRNILLNKEEYRFLLKYLQLNASDTGAVH
ncbi:trimethylamine-N-oxide reductase cytochrome c-type subunit TorC [Desulfobaculum xiamenense]|uniref:Trimethylamine-N-oxide reductase cytochrome c-type subunit TorC n=1 Tax=Desulfobaculum xiamenense TaxID=995050 RepID=A0A846QQL4_9BACT|nr:NapC/NirT family cytochrome c [Desulfobaculum xiamenense]NJB69467.1 trimethylamine-N-oxide reductase cytochrome c-type subunit TorC [Desulfobaculum xiamenense]